MEAGLTLTHKLPPVVPRHLAIVGHNLYFNPKYEEFRSQNVRSLSDAFSSPFKELDPIPQYRATTKLRAFLEATQAY